MHTLLFFFFNDTATTEIYTLSLHDALPIYIFGTILGLAVVIAVACVILIPKLVPWAEKQVREAVHRECKTCEFSMGQVRIRKRSEEHTSELQSRQYLVCRLLLEKNNYYIYAYSSVFFF